jgi:hypothetical protein
MEWTWQDIQDGLGGFSEPTSEETRHGRFHYNLVGMLDGLVDIPFLGSRYAFHIKRGFDRNESTSTQTEPDDHSASLSCNLLQARKLATLNSLPMRGSPS